MSYDKVADALLEVLLCQRHYELTGQPLLPRDFPCVQAIDEALRLDREADRAVTDLTNDTAHPG